MRLRAEEHVPVRSGARPAGDEGGTLLLCFSHLRWGFVWQRPQHLLTRAARDFRVLFVEEPVFRPGALPHIETHDQPSGVRVVLPVLPGGLAPQAIDRAQRDLILDLLASGRPERLILWYYTPMAITFSAEIPADAVVFDKMDELSAFRGASPEMIANEAALLARADLVFTGGRSLYEATRGRHSDVHLFPSSIDFGHFAQARAMRGSDPADQAGIPHPRLGFVGVVDERMDVDLVRDFAAARPDWHIVMIGPVVKIDPAQLPRSSNLHWLGPRSYDELPAYLAGWDVALMPFALNESTRFISPTKTPEYLAAGLPVVSTPIADVVAPYGKRGFVEIAGSAAEFVARIESCLGADRTDRLADVDAFLRQGSWNTTWNGMGALIGDVLDRPTPMPAAEAAE